MDLTCRFSEPDIRQRSKFPEESITFSYGSISITTTSSQSRFTDKSKRKVLHNKMNYQETCFLHVFQRNCRIPVIWSTALKCQNLELLPEILSMRRYSPGRIKNQHVQTKTACRRNCSLRLGQYVAKDAEFFFGDASHQYF